MEMNFYIVSAHFPGPLPPLRFAFHYGILSIQGMNRRLGYSKPFHIMLEVALAEQLRIGEVVSSQML